MKKKVPKCDFDGCKNDRAPRDRFCHSHKHKVTISRFLNRSYNNMARRVQGKSTKRPDLYKGKSIINKDVFMIWAKNHTEFLRLYKMWINTGFDRRFTPSVNRLTSKTGYLLHNMEWVTNSQNCKLAHAVRDINHKKEIYRLIGVNK